MGTVNTLKGGRRGLCFVLCLCFIKVGVRDGRWAVGGEVIRLVFLAG